MISHGFLFYSGHKNPLLLLNVWIVTVNSPVHWRFFGRGHRLRFRKGKDTAGLSATGVPGHPLVDHHCSNQICQLEGIPHFQTHKIIIWLVTSYSIPIINVITSPVYPLKFLLLIGESPSSDHWSLVLYPIIILAIIHIPSVSPLPVGMLKHIFVVHIFIGCISYYVPMKIQLYPQSQDIVKTMLYIIIYCLWSSIPKKMLMYKFLWIDPLPISSISSTMACLVAPAHVTTWPLWSTGPPEPPLGEGSQTFRCCRIDRGTWRMVSGYGNTSFENWCTADFWNMFYVWKFLASHVKSSSRVLTTMILYTPHIQFHQEVARGPN